ncbi:MAG: FecR domain-containing protein [Pseudomonadota bacterium]
MSGTPEKFEKRLNLSDADYRKIVRTANEWRTRVASASLSESDRVAFEAWLAEDIRHEEIYDQAVTFWASYDYLRPGDIEDDLLRKSWPERLSRAMENGTALVGSRPVIFAAVLAAVTLIAIPILFSRPDVVLLETVSASYSTAAGETQVLTLADGTVVTLGPDTTIAVTLHGHKRSVELERGAGFFSVAADPNRPFSVRTDRLTAQALGTAFEVRNNGGVARVGVAEGRVEVSYPFVVQGKPTGTIARKELIAGDQIAADRRDGLREIEPIATNRVGAWREAMLIYNGATLEELVADVNRYSEKTISLGDVPDEVAASQINASFPASDVEAMLSMLGQLYPVTIDDSDPGNVRVVPRQAPDQSQRNY